MIIFAYFEVSVTLFKKLLASDLCILPGHVNFVVPAAVQMLLKFLTASHAQPGAFSVKMSVLNHQGKLPILFRMLSDLEIRAGFLFWEVHTSKVLVDRTKRRLLFFICIRRRNSSDYTKLNPRVYSLLYQKDVRLTIFCQNSLYFLHKTLRTKQKAAGNLAAYLYNKNHSLSEWLARKL